ncbi:hypothetical protein CHLRE_17g727050v5 [Chlamydomonas reinhardtii]|uniref:Uncharacterized protein n=1 Tax=Chlamydomonas reinhardtii TaxID=3055 RepID=A0A2K3CQQ8_CHLRE|nr:uncharacterized protein CHLRE_17g727050v5 [Chlamydomonas reinhardtii]PNW70612.1 hypothetical protein CHLRE_17g727050v5 [Chlamydomonas reinhardtii]
MDPAGPRRRSAAYEHRSVIGNILTPTSGPPGQADYRVTPASRGTGQAAVSRPPWATELDDGGGGYGAPLPGRPGSASRPRPGADARSAHEEFSFATPPSRAAGSFAGPGGSGGQGDQLDLWTQQQAQQHPHQQPRPSSGSARTGFDAGLYARVDHDAGAHGPPGAAALTPGESASSLGRRVGSVGTGGGVARLQGGSMSSTDSASGELSATGRAGSGRAAAVGAGAGTGVQPAPTGAARAPGRPPPGAGAPGPTAGSSSSAAAAASASSRVGASPARGAAAARAGAAAGTGGGASTSSAGGAAPGSRSTSTPRPRPGLPPKRSTSDSPRRPPDWVDVAEPAPSRGSAAAAAMARGGGGGGSGGGGPAPRRPGAGAAVRAVGRGGSAGAAEGRWDGGDNDGDRGSWLFAGDPDATEAEPSMKAAAPAARSGGAKGAAADRRPVPAPAPVNEWDEVPVGGARARQAAVETTALVDSHEPAGPPERRQHWAQAQSDWDTSLAEEESGRLGGAGGGGGAGGRSLDRGDSAGGRGTRQAGGSGLDWGEEGEERHGGHTGPTSFGRRAAKPHGSPGPAPAAAAVTSSGGGAGLEATFSSSPNPAASFTFGGLASGGLGHGLAAGEAVPRAPSRGGSSGASGGGAGRGPSAGSASADSKQMQALQEENARLREQVEHLQRLAAMATATAAGGSGPDATALGRRAAAPAGAAPAQRPYSASAAEAARGPVAALAAANAAGVHLQQYKSQVVQLQRQVALMSREMEAKSRMAAEAEGALLATAERLQELVAATAPAAASDDAAPLSRDQLAQLHKWSKQMLGRLKSEKSQSARLFSRQDLADSIARAGRAGGAGTGGGLGGLSPSWGDSSSTGAGGGAAGAPAQTWQVPFIAAGGNRFLQAAAAAASAADDGSGVAAAVPPPPGPSVAAIASGQAALLADPLLAHRLELQLAAVAPKLAAVAVLLKTQLLPAMPWLSMEASDRLQAETSEAAESVAQAAEGLVQLCSLLPAGAAVFGDAAVAGEPKRRAAEVEAGRDAWLYGSPDMLGAPPEQPMVDEAGLVSVSRVQAALTPLLRDRKAGGRALGDVLEPLRAAAAAGAAKRAVLEAELRFAARSGGLAAEHVAHLMMSVGMALEDVRAAKDTAAIKSYFGAAAAVRQVLQAADSLEVHPCEACLKALVEQVRAQRDWLDRLPDLLVNAPAADVEGRLLGKVEELHQGFKKALGKLDAHKRRTLDVHARRAGGDAAGEDEDAEGGGYEDDWQGDEGGEEGGSQRPHGHGGARGGATGTGTGTGRAGAAAANPPKPSPPRREWQD